MEEEIKGLKFKRDNVENIEVRSLPSAGINPVWPKIRLIVLVSSILGFLSTAALALFLGTLFKRKRSGSQ